MIRVLLADWLTRLAMRLAYDVALDDVIDAGRHDERYRGQFVGYGELLLAGLEARREGLALHNGED